MQQLKAMKPYQTKLKLNIRVNRERIKRFKSIFNENSSRKNC